MEMTLVLREMILNASTAVEETALSNVEMVATTIEMFGILDCELLGC